MELQKLKEQLKNGEFKESLSKMYACDVSDTKKYAERFLCVADSLFLEFGNCEDIRLFSAPGRTEIGGNHTDHQKGWVLAGSLSVDVIGAVSKNGENVVRIKSKGYPIDIIELDDLEPDEKDSGTSRALIKGILKCFSDRGYKLFGFNAYTTSNVLKGSGMSSSASFEVLVSNIANSLFANGELSPTELAKIGRYAENVYFKKPSGLMDQMASAIGGIVAIDFSDESNPTTEKVDFDFKRENHALCIIDSGADHSDLTSEYAEITEEMKRVSEFFGKNYLGEISCQEFMKSIKNLRKTIKNDRAILRALHFFKDNKCAKEEAKALKDKDFEKFLKLLKKSGYSSYMYLQNVYTPKNPKNQAVSLVLALCEELLGERGAYRVHGGGFAGTVQAFVPYDMLEEFKSRMDEALFCGACNILSIREVGGCELKKEQ